MKKVGGCCYLCVILHQHQSLPASRSSRRSQITQQIMNIDKQFNFFLLAYVVCVCTTWEKSRKAYSISISINIKRMETTTRKKWFILGNVRGKSSLASAHQIDFSKAINFVCHSYNLTDFSLWLMMAIVDLWDIRLYTLLLSFLIVLLSLS